MFRLLRPAILFKHRGFLLGFGVIAITAGFSLPSIPLYDLITRALSSGVLPRFIAISIGSAIIGLNFLVVRQSLSMKYAVPFQVTFASLGVLLVLTVCAFSGFWLRIRMEYLTPSAESILGVQPIVTASRLPPSVIAAILSLTFTLSLFSLVYSIAAEPYARADYSRFHTIIKLLFGQLRELVLTDNPRGLRTITSEDIQGLALLSQNAVDTLTSSLSYEAGHYGTFVRSDILDPLTRLTEFLKSRDVVNHPQYILELGRETSKIGPEWIKKEGFHMAYQKLVLTLGTS
jgi:hypothetical protein